MCKVIAIANQKGGVGKTTTSINLSSGLCEHNRKVLLIDMDPQGNVSRGFGVDIDLLNKCIFDVLAYNVNIEEVIQHTMIKNLDLISSKLILSSLDSAISGKVIDPFNLLKHALKKVKDNYDYIIIDCPPSLALLTLNSLCAADSVLIPVQCEYFAMEAVAQILATIASVQNQYNPKLTIEGFLLTMYDAKARLCLEIATEVRGLFKENTFITMIPRNISIPESNAKGLPVTIYRPTSTGAMGYLALAKEVIEHEKREDC